MTWTKLDDDFPDRDEILALSDAAFRAHVCGLIHSNRLLTDGRISAARAALIAGPAVLDELVARGIWDRDGDGYQIVDSLEDQPTAEKVRGDREAAKARVSAWRAKQRRLREASGRRGGRNSVRTPVRTAPQRNAPPDPSPFLTEGTDATGPNVGGPVASARPRFMDSNPFCGVCQQPFGLLVDTVMTRTADGRVVEAHASCPAVTSA